MARPSPRGSRRWLCLEEATEVIYGDGVQRVVLDVDTGIDDALALLYAVACPGLELCGVTAVSGNVPAATAARNSAAVLSRAGAVGVPVACGAAATLDGAGPCTGPSNHGPDGLGGVGLPPGPEPHPDVRSLMGEAASGGPVTLVGLAPLTNVAALAAAADRLVLVAGELVPEEPPELNAAHDLIATAGVLAADRPTTLYVADVFERVSATAADVARLRAASGPAARLAADLMEVRRDHLVGDVGALVLLTHPHLFRVEPRRMGLVAGHLTEASQGRRVDVVADVDARGVADAFVQVLLDA